jgi:hypothetical protein
MGNGICVELGKFKLWNCPFSIQCFQTIVRLGKLGKLADFLKTVQSLENLYLTLPEPLEENNIAEGILNHAQTLKRDIIDNSNAISLEHPELDNYASL